MGGRPGLRRKPDVRGCTGARRVRGRDERRGAGMETSVDRIARPWGGRTPYGRHEQWPTRVDTCLQAGVGPEQVQRWVRTASVLHSDGDAWTSPSWTAAWSGDRDRDRDRDGDGAGCGTGSTAEAWAVRPGPAHEDRWQRAGRPG